MITIWQGTWVLPAVTPVTLSSPSMRDSGEPRMNLMSCDSQCDCTKRAMSLSMMRGTTWSNISTTVTSLPLSRSAKAISRPITPAPATTTCLVFGSQSIIA
ncbi:MAG: hypothetical protein A4E30_00652 [Methanomassiliicoccales archaeon PtaB.Bin215]|nr:MAG: hypothetical protein A4E30_00652 [Methanomassiliicoccales archaeon PtaB.Bin215]